MQGFQTLGGILSEHQEGKHRDDLDLFDAVDVDGDGCVALIIFTVDMACRYIGLDDLESIMMGMIPKPDLAEIRQLLIDITEGTGLQANKDTFKSWVIQVRYQWPKKWDGSTYK